MHKYKKLNIDKVNDALWYLRARSQKIVISGPILKEVAQKLAKTLLSEDEAKGFKASDEWLNSFKERH